MDFACSAPPLGRGVLVAAVYHPPPSTAEPPASLNPAQLAAVHHLSGPCQVLIVGARVEPYSAAKVVNNRHALAIGRTLPVPWACR